MTPILMFWPVWFVLAVGATVAFVQAPTLYGIAVLSVLCLVGSLQAVNTWREARREIQGWMRGRG